MLISGNNNKGTNDNTKMINYYHYHKQNSNRSHTDMENYEDNHNGIKQDNSEDCDDANVTIIILIKK